MHQFVHDHILPAVYSLLPDRMESERASVMLMAIAFQESGFMHREQVRGPARGYWQFETAGVHGVLTHRATSGHARAVCINLGYQPNLLEIHSAIRDNDVLAGAFARLLMFTVPDPLPSTADLADAWRQYLWAWRPGKPHRDRWDANHAKAVNTVKGHRTGDK